MSNSIFFITRISNLLKIISKSVSKLRHRRAVGWTFIFLFFTLVVGSGIAGFLIRPPQKATLTARFSPDTKLVVQEIRDKCPTDDGKDAPGVISGIVSGVALYAPFVRPLDLTLPMSPEVFDRLAKSLGVVGCRQCNFIELSNSNLKLDFNQPITVYIEGNGVNEDHLNRLLDGNIELGMYPSPDKAGDTRDAILRLRVTNANFEMKMEANGSDLGQFALYPDQAITKTIRLLPNRGPNGEGKVDLLFPITQTDKGISFHAEICAKHVELEDTSQGVLTLGPLIQKVGWGERLKMEMDQSDRIVIEGERIVINARNCENAGIPKTPWTNSKKPCIVDAIHNDVAELLPLWFTLWSDWAHGLWSTFAIGTGSATFLQFLKKLNLWPSFKE